MPKKAAVYLRSSKDRSQVSLSAQRAELESLASKHGLEIAIAFEDAVISGSSDDRPAFQDLISAIKDRNRGWSHILVYDTSRIARGRFIAQAFRHECKRHGVELLIARVPETDPISAVILEAVLEAMDEVHSMMSRDKGLAGMRQNIAKGWRAGGKAPVGYELVHEATGAIRDGRPVMKSKLVTSDQAAWVTAYLQARAACEPRTSVTERMAIELPHSSLIAIEWNALAYAGHTVWNRHKEKRARGDGRSKVRPRAEWLVKRDTHPALITDLQAEAVLAQISTSSVAESIRRARTHTSTFLLAGLMVTSDGRPWVGAGSRYRLKPMGESRGKYVDRTSIEAAVVAQVRADAADQEFIERLTTATRRWYPKDDPGNDLAKEAQRLEREADRAAKLALETVDPGPFIAIMEGKRQKAEAVRRQADAARKDAAAIQATRTISPEAVQRAILGDQTDAALVRSLVAKVVLEPDLSCRIDYLPAIGRSLAMASPRRDESWAISSKVSGF